MHMQCTRNLPWLKLRWKNAVRSKARRHTFQIFNQEWLWIYLPPGFLAKSRLSGLVRECTSKAHPASPQLRCLLLIQVWLEPEDYDVYLLPHRDKLGWPMMLTRVRWATFVSHSNLIFKWLCITARNSHYSKIFTVFTDCIKQGLWNKVEGHFRSAELSVTMCADVGS